MIDLTERELSAEQAEAVQRLLSGAGAPAYVFGRNKYAERISRSVPVEAFIDDHTTDNSYLGKPVVRLADVPRDRVVVSCVVNARPLTALDRLKTAGVRQVIDYYMLSRLAPGVFAPADYCADEGRDIRQNVSRYEWVYNLLADEVSRQHFSKVLRFRLTLDVETMRGFTLAVDRQYFEEFLPVRAGEVFVDGGGYDGETSRRFAAWNPDYRRIHYFEPSPVMMGISQQNLAPLRDVRFVQKGLFNQSNRLPFDDCSGDASRIAAGGQTAIEVVSLDEEVAEPVTFVKLDVEGAENEAIEGAAGHIRAETPTLAVCIYHEQCDFWRIPQRVLELNDRYRVYVRHYTEGILETVMFFVPRTE